MTVVYEEWIGREEERSERILGSVVEAMAATLDLERSPQAGEALPPGWQWLFFNPVVRRNALGNDGHPRRGGFLPPIALPRRMWAGSRIRYLADLPVEAQETRHSRILKIESKEGKSGSLSFVTVQHTISCGGTPCISEEQDIVYREATPPGVMTARAAKPYDGVPQWSRSVAPDTFVVDGSERGHPHFYCDAATLMALFAGFELLSLKQQQHRKPGSWHWHIIAERRP